MNFNYYKKSTIIFFVLVIILILYFIFRLPNPIFKDNYSTVILDKHDKILRVYLNKDSQWIIPPENKKIPQKIEEAVINFEDKRFYNHIGIDFIAFMRAAKQNIIKRHVVSGGSTITMQVARLIRPKERHIFNKVLEIIQAFLIELKYSKKEILKLYLEHAPYGNNIVGYRTASLKYFGVEAENLTWSQSATLAVIPKNPNAVKNLKGMNSIFKKKNKLLKKLYEKKIIGKDSYELAISESVNLFPKPFPLAAPHLSDTIKKSNEGKIVKTSIDFEIQENINNIVNQYMNEFKKNGVNNCAVLVAETKSGKIRSYIGSNNYFDHINGGQVDGVMASNSTGSILKPFLYGLMIDEGELVSETKIEDVPKSYRGYTPYNMNMQFQGIVSAKEALISSLNSPAVMLLKNYGVEKYYNFLKNAGMTTLFREPDGYGLSLILGGAEGSLYDITSMYNGLGNYGNFRGLTYFEDKKLETGKQLISTGSSWITLEMLHELRRPGVEYYWQNFSNQWGIAWKTGTSYGNRDAWAVGVSPQWTIGVWLGNFNEKECKALSGIEAAAPLFFSIFASLPKENYSYWFKIPSKDMTTIDISAESGYRASEFCENKIRIYYPKDAKPLKTSPYEKIIYTNKAGTEEVCSLCWKEGDIVKKSIEVYPPQVLTFLRGKGNRQNAMIPHKRTCPSIQNHIVDIIYPQEDTTILVPRNFDGKYEKVKFKAGSSYLDTKLYWYLDNNFLGETLKNHEIDVELETGKHKLFVTDENGNNSDVNFYSERKR